MNDLPFILRLATNFWLMLASFVALLIVLHILLICIFRPSKVGWKFIDYFSLVIAAVGLINLTADARVFIASNQLPIATGQVSFSLYSLRQSLSPSANDLCKQSIRSNVSPTNFDEIKKQYDAACEWLHGASKMLPSGDGPPFTKIDFSDTNFPAWIDYPVILTEVSNIRQLFANYEAKRVFYEEVKSRLGKTEGEEFNLVLGPLLLCIAIALSITKVTGEILHERRVTPN